MAVVIPSALVALLSLTSVEIVRDVGEIPQGIPTPVLPSLSAITPDVLTGALAVAVIILVQGAGVSQSVPNPDGSRRSTSRDFIAQGAGNVASGLFRGLPVGGSLSATALNVIYGAQSRWAVVFAGAWMALIVIVFPGVVSYIAMPALGALLILAGASSIKLGELRAIWAIGWSPRIASIATFLATLVLPIQVAVGIGVVLSALLYVNRSSTDISVVELVERPDGRIEERERPTRAPIQCGHGPRCVRAVVLCRCPDAGTTPAPPTERTEPGGDPAAARPFRRRRHAAGGSGYLCRQARSGERAAVSDRHQRACA